MALAQSSTAPPLRATANRQESNGIRVIGTHLSDNAMELYTVFWSIRDVTVIVEWWNHPQTSTLALLVFVVGTKQYPVCTHCTIL